MQGEAEHSFSSPEIGRRQVYLTPTDHRSLPSTQGEGHPRTGHDGPEGSRGIALLLNLGARWRWLVNATPRPPCPRERPGAHCTGGWMGPRAGLDGCGKISLPPGFDPKAVQPVASRYTD